MVEVITGNLFDTDAKFLAHQINCQGVMGSGVARQVKERYPEVFSEYKKLCDSCNGNTGTILGCSQWVDVSDDRTIINLFGQDGYGYDSATYTSIEELKLGFNDLAEASEREGCKVAMPYMIGCARGGADWDEVYAIIEKTFANVEVKLYKLPEGVNDNDI